MNVPTTKEDIGTWPYNHAYGKDSKNPPNHAKQKNKFGW